MSIPKPRIGELCTQRYRETALPVQVSFTFIESDRRIWHFSGFLPSSCIYMFVSCGKARKTSGSLELVAFPTKIMRQAMWRFSLGLEGCWSWKWVFPVSQQHPANSGLWIPRDGGCAWQVICFVCCDMQGHSQAVPVIAQNPWQSPSSLGLSRKELWQYFTTVISWYYLWVTDVFLSFLHFYFLSCLFGDWLHGI